MEKLRGAERPGANRFSLSVIDAPERGIRDLAQQLARDQQTVVLGIVYDKDARRFAHVHEFVLFVAGRHGPAPPDPAPSAASFRQFRPVRAEL